LKSIDSLDESDQNAVYSPSGRLADDEADHVVIDPVAAALESDSTLAPPPSTERRSRDTVSSGVVLVPDE
jgi:hypothetical protein